MPEKKLRFPSYGGQALLEGVMMRGSKYVTAVFRKPNGELSIHKEELTGLYKSRLIKIPFLRGMIILLDALLLGTRLLVLSANQQTGEEEKIEGPALYGTVGVSLVIGIGIFFVLPTLIAGGLEKNIETNSFVINFIEGIIRLIFLMVYVWAIGKMPEIHRFFAYHGAEHKTINAYEAKVELSPENISPFPLEHPRCGTGFLLIVVVISIVVFALLGPLDLIWRILSRILLIPVIVILAYEYMRWTANHLSNPIVRMLVFPNLWLQKMTTREPSPDMLEVSSMALKELIALENSNNI